MNDPNYYDRILDRDPAFVNRFDKPTLRLEPFIMTCIEFDVVPSRTPSRNKRSSLEPLIQSIVGKFPRSLEGFAGSGKEVLIRRAYECLTHVT